MKLLEELDQAIQKVTEIAINIKDQTNSEIWNKAPLIIHQRFCAELVRLAKTQPNKALNTMPKALDVLTAIKLLEELYPELKSE